MTENQQRIIKFIEDYVKVNHYAPSYREIGIGVDMSSVASVNYNLGKLAMDGYIDKGLEPRTIKANNLVVLDKYEVERIKEKGKEEMAHRVLSMIHEGVKVEDMRIILEKHFW